MTTRPKARSTALEPTLRRGMELLDARRFVAARKVLRDVVLARGADAGWAVQELIQSYLRRGEGALVEPALRELLREDDPLLLHGLGYLYRRTGRAAEARTLFERAVAARR